MIKIEIEDYPKYKVEEIKIKSTIDGSMEPSLFCAAEGDEKRPLVVSLHSWSFDRHNQVSTLYPVAKRNNWHVLWPDFRGNNNVENPRANEACGSQLAMQDIIDAVDYICENYNVDKDFIFLVGGSGGGHMAMMMTAYRPKLWRSVAAFCGITNLVDWHGENPGYSAKMEACCGGKPEGDALEEYKKRSPINYAAEMIKANELYIYHGKYDKSVPVTHGMNMYAKTFELDKDAKVFLTVFDGGHAQLVEEAEKQFLKCLNIDNSQIKITG